MGGQVAGQDGANDGAAAGFASSEPLSLPRMLGRRILLKLVARGGMGDVYLGATTGIEGAERPCIVKTVRRDHIHDGSFLARFLDEARVQSQLQHPGVAQVLEAANDDAGEPFTVVEYVEGRALSDVRQRAIQSGSKIAWADAVAVAIEIAQALAHVHERPGPDGSPLGIVHRDLSPQNVMIGYAGEVKLIDFGTARGHNRRCHTVAGVVFAKPGYVAPEVARQQVGDGRIDVYALGIMLWELCAGRRFLNSDPQRHLDDAAAGNVVIPRVSEASGAPPELDDVIAKLTKNDPEERYARASLAVPELARVLSAAPFVEGGERGVRARIALLMRTLWPHEPARSRAEFARLLRDGRKTLEGSKSDTTPAAGPISAAMAKALEPGDPSVLLGTPYRLVKRIGEGASGVVWEAEHTELGRRLALKILAPEHGTSQAALERFRREARAVAKLSHPNLVSITDFGRSLDGRAYLAMELLVGETLDGTLKHGPLLWAEAVRIASETARALGAAHAAGLVHRDIKPQNLFLTKSGQVRLLDFGVATALSHGSDRKPTEQERAMRGFAIFGTPEYMAPEQARGEEATAQSDLYALGVLFFEMLTGQLPFRSDDREALLEMQRTSIAPRPRTIKPDVLPAAESIVVRLLEKDRRKRFQDAHHLHEELKSLQRSLPNTPWEVAATGENAVPPPPPPPQSPGVIEWASRAALFSRMVSRAYPGTNAPPDVQNASSQAWDLAARATRLEGEVASHTRKLEALERRGRALRAEIGRKVEELAHEESRALRDLSSEQAEVARLREGLQHAERTASSAKQAADTASGSGTTLRTVFERAGAASALVEAKREQLKEHEQKAATKDTQARDLRRQIEELRAQLARYAEALEEDLASGREKVAARTREGLAYEKAFSEVSGLLLNHLKTRPEARDLLQELIAAMHGQSGSAQKSESRTPP